MNNQRLKPQITQIILLATCYSLLCTLLGCEAFVRKFTRKSKKSKTQQEIVMRPQEYSFSDISTEERYRQYFLFWKSWQEELITALSPSGSHKKQISCLKEAIRNLEQVWVLLSEQKQEELDVYLDKLRHLEAEIDKDIYGFKSATHKTKAEVLKRNILRDFSYPKISEDILK